MKTNKTSLLLKIAALLAAFLLIAACGRTAPVERVRDPETEIDEAEAEAEEEEEEAPETEEETTRSPADRTAEEVYAANPELTPVNYDSPALLPLTEDMGQEYVDNIVFLCDSPFYWLKLYELLSDGYGTTQVWTGPEGTMTLAYLRDFKILDPIDNVERTIPETVAIHQPPVIMITVGINGIAFMDEAYFKEEYTNLVNEIREADPDVTLIFQSILPISPAYSGWGDITNETVTAANAWLLELAEALDAHYLDSFSCLVGEDGNIQPDLVMSDGLHANKEGLTKVLEYIRTHAVEE